LQVASTLFPAFGLPDWPLRGVILLLAIGFVPARVAAATPADAAGTWTPYVGFEVDGSVIQLAMLEGSTIVCTLIEPR
jgi:hypothetical protein